MVKNLARETGESEKRKALERVLASSAFHRTGQLKSLLRFICEREISGQGESLDECTVAVEALGRPHDYSPFEDGTVRNRIHNLRRRLEQYYETDNPDDRIHIVIPKGSYCPQFEYRTLPEANVREGAAAVTASAKVTPEVAPAVAPIAPEFWKRQISMRSCAIGLALMVAVLGLGLYERLQTTHPGFDPVITAAWGPLVAAGSNPLLCLSTAAQLTVIQRPAIPFTAPTVSSPDLKEWYHKIPGLPESKNVYLGPSLTSPFWGDVAGAMAISQVFSGAGIRTELLPEAEIRLPALNRRNLIIFGRPGFSKTIDLYLLDKPFRVRIPDEEHTTSIWNVEPRPGEPSEFNAKVASNESHRETAFGLITVMPSLGDANLRTVVLSGTLSPGTQAAAEFFSSPKHLQALLKLFQREGYMGFPNAWQVVVRSTVFNTSALDVRYVTHRVLTPKAAPAGSH